MAKIIDLIYTLDEKEAYTAIKKSGMYKNTGKRAIIENIILAVFAFFFFYAYFANHTNGEGFFNLVMGILCLVFIVVLNVIPITAMKKQSKNSSKELKMHLTVSKITMSDGKNTWGIPLDGTSRYKLVDDDKLILIKTPDRQLVVLPTRAIPREMTVEIQSRIFGGMVED